MKPSHGGHRPGAGRKSGSGTFGEATRPLRVPQSRVAIVRAYLDACRRGQPNVDLIGTDLFVAANASSIASPADTSFSLPLVGRVAAGRPILSDAHIEREVIVDRYLFRPRPHFLLRVEGDSMRDVGILDSDLIAVHRTPTAEDGQIVIARIEDEITVKRLRRTSTRIRLLSANPDYPPIEVDPESETFAIEGVYVGALRMSMPRTSTPRGR
jgi:SOS-response transcriptional repressor LexA